MLLEHEGPPRGVASPRLPNWLRKPQTHFVPVHGLKQDLRRHGLNTVCESARCPNMHECFNQGTAAFLILGNTCTRSCGFCAVRNSHSAILAPDPAEPARVARMAAEMGLKHVVITSVTRDDLQDGGAGHFAVTIRETRRALPGARIEVLTPDFAGSRDSIARVLDAAPDIFNHNVETVPRLYSRVRPQAVYARSLGVLAFARSYYPDVLAKSGFMVGLGEEPAEVELLLRELRTAGVDIVTIGQYLQPSHSSLPAVAYISPEQFEAYRNFGLAIGFRTVFSGPFVRSSYMADAVGRAALEGAGAIA